MILLRPDCLIFQTTDGEQVPCSAEWVTMELMGESASLIDPAIVHNASAAVLHYFKHELHRDHVSVGEFAVALEKALRGFGLSVFADGGGSEMLAEAPVAAVVSIELEPALAPLRALDIDLRAMAVEADKGFELAFFPQLRDEVRRRLEESPNVMRFGGLRGCVKQLAGARRWSRRCQTLNDQIVDYLRTCWEREGRSDSGVLVVH